MSLAEQLIDCATLLMPRERRGWAQAMRRELLELHDPSDAAGFALGCLRVAFLERLQPMKTFATAGRWVVAALTVLYALFHLKMAWNGVNIMLGGPDWYHDKLIAWGHPDQAAQVVAQRPHLIAYMLAMGITHLGAALFLVRWRPKAFYAFATAAAVVTLYVAGPGVVMTISGEADRPTASYALQITLVALLTGAAFLLARMHGHGSRHPAIEA